MELDVAPLQGVIPDQEGTYPPATWRLIIDDQPRSGAANMAMDQALAESAAAGDAPPPYASTAGSRQQSAWVATNQLQISMPRW